MHCTCQRSLAKIVTSTTLAMPGCLHVIQHKDALELQVSREGKALGKLVLALQETGQRCIIGRDTTPGACDMVLEHASVSRKHAHLVAGPAGSLTLIDLGSGMLLAA